MLICFWCGQEIITDKNHLLVEEEVDGMPRPFHKSPVNCLKKFFECDPRVACLSFEHQKEGIRR
ncbi:hypothetical protein A2609_02675 [Candidatus Kaiserbacteria bacterium RIFOXYD1_FULL_47_14]|uniref:Uncharacterized protein n=1 Tax=Candidatus Kaiserbacteria bacterium RIFOXYD1_FULL_47_14 TaxID=1798533 RepID=A0A1F6G4Y1_9BACT|nr:MAG: hypothetical protein A2609_02675 [Candidatus Kaiserbacteria bacterium RIFOXYD1_FULL_47_14]